MVTEVTQSPPWWCATCCTSIPSKLTGLNGGCGAPQTSSDSRETPRGVISGDDKAAEQGMAFGIAWQTCQLVVDLSPARKETPLWLGFAISGNRKGRLKFAKCLYSWVSHSAYTAEAALPYMPRDPPIERLGIIFAVLAVSFVRFRARLRF